MHSEEQYARRAFKSGAAGYITKDSPRAELAAAIRKVREGGKYVSPALAEKLVVDLQRDTELAPHESLSDREFQVMRLIASGKTVTEIAALLSISDRTVSTYRARVLEKMQMKTNAACRRQRDSYLLTLRADRAWGGGAWEGLPRPQTF
jgi:two-component system, NarL family, invasion response regulator UvrY